MLRRRALLRHEPRLEELAGLVEVGPLLERHGLGAEDARALLPPFLSCFALAIVERFIVARPFPLVPLLVGAAHAILREDLARDPHHLLGRGVAGLPAGEHRAHPAHEAFHRPSLCAHDARIRRDLVPETLDEPVEDGEEFGVERTPGYLCQEARQDAWRREGAEQVHGSPEDAPSLPGLLVQSRHALIVVLAGHVRSTFPGPLVCVSFVSRHRGCLLIRARSRWVRRRHP
ncbi:hypothetical protein WMF31_05450 [Sorangium sp. So ce1036]|uniref:hypothetical protein n=1 Tax=Sorangium sp. So ce1036 TaxID=3133328 RepID=UPI003EFE89AB